MQNRVMLMVMVDGLRARALGAYGNTCYPTPALDRLASQGILFDRFLSESSKLSDVYDALWTGRHALDGAAELQQALVDQWKDDGYLCHLVTDDPEIAERSEAQQFDEVLLVDGASQAPATEVFDTVMGRVLEAAADLLGGWSSEYEQPRLLWIHLRGLLAPWDAPSDLAESLLDEDDPELAVSLEVPHQEIAVGDAGADEVFLAGCRYAGQVMALDRCLGAIDNLLEELWPEVAPTVVLAGSRGFALGEHGQLGTAGPAYRELFHVPLLMRGTMVPAMARESSLTQTSDLHALLASLARNESPTHVHRAIAVGESNGSRFVETDEWQYMVRQGNEPASELYVAPDDMWQANDIASRCPTELEQFERLVDAIDHHVSTSQSWRDLLPTPDDQ